MVERAVAYLAFVFLLIAMLLEQPIPFAIGP